ncbi:histidine kinase dimerization/phospho-acceptor domain-containing protein [Methylomonas koyamae]|uniref:histidine kinase dimerization/phospho-acceptor domain-containing protein n=1 Tax=Methylomonas koyamae TaxID=702114 RepID=UPI000AB2D395|nr:histidine kinase dimerization/phospho-acceptor domain-containing protein [Methylomonas koyamae]
MANTGPIDRDRRHAGIYYQLVADNRVLRRTGPTPDEPFVTDFDRHKGFRTAWVGIVPWRVFVLRDEDGGAEVQVGQPLQARTEILEELADDLIWPAMTLLALLGAVIWLAISRLIGPIEQTALTIAGKTPEDLTPVAVIEQPVELQPIVNALNTVLGRLDHALQAERRFTADAAHELRTPLSALRMKIQLLERQHPEHRPSLRQLYHDTDRCTALIENLLTLARFDAAQAATVPRESVALPDLLDELRRYHLPQAETGQIELAVECSVATLVGNADLLRIALRNLLDNALRYCPPGCRVRIEARSIAAGIRLTVRDDGPGVEASQRSQLAGRFFFECSAATGAEAAWGCPSLSALPRCTAPRCISRPASINAA